MASSPTKSAPKPAGEGNPRATGGGEDVGVAAEYEPRQAEGDEGVEGEGAERVGGCHRLHARPAHEDHRCE